MMWVYLVVPLIGFVIVPLDYLGVFQGTIAGYNHPKDVCKLGQLSTMRMIMTPVVWDLSDDVVHLRGGIPESKGWSDRKSYDPGC